MTEISPELVEQVRMIGIRGLLRELADLRMNQAVAAKVTELINLVSETSPEKVIETCKPHLMPLLGLEYEEEITGWGGTLTNPDGSLTLVGEVRGKRRMVSNWSEFKEKR